MSPNRCTAGRVTPPISTGAPPGRSRPPRPSRPARCSPARSWRGCAAARRPGPASRRLGSMPATAIVEGRAQAAARCRRARARHRQCPARLQGHRVARCGVQLARRGRRCSRPFDRLIEPGDRIGIVGRQRLGQVDPARPPRRASPADIGAASSEVPPSSLGYYDQLGRELDLTQRVRDAVAGPHQAAPSVEDVTGSWSGSGSTATPSGLPSAPCRVGSGGACSCC